MQIATWNINSLKVRLAHVLTWVKSQHPDILALQELKQESSFFPEKVFQEEGYFSAVNGQKTYNGVAIISKYPIENIETPDYDHQKRIVSVELTAQKKKLNIINVYVPNGESVGSDKYQYKLDWLKYLKDLLFQKLQKNLSVIVLGDFNIAPTDEDVHDPKLWHEKVLCSDKERNALQAILNLGFFDSFRLFQQPPKSYSWWDYRMLGFRRNAGLRIDHVLLSESLKKHCLKVSIDKEPRKWERPSDHAPVIAELETNTR